ncbi:transcription factor bHLH154-like [Olea europaea var. sylvestris]|uniref:Transcription factor bHLH113 n=1 Tax=Olea europaea subsp. europaea TaxID=158383 RepID=A0A8S0PUH8_OLEEU|nr:transcription factor bHLH154-like [Olea europaea var. sylvestris]CAA2958195.1 transcription factor bHLH113 [Olea europaea subsp. europaea]
MASNGAFEDEPVAEGRYSQLLLGDDEIMNLEANECFNFSPFFSSGYSPKLLRFADYQKECKTGVACSDSSSASSTKASDIITLPKSNKKRNVSRNPEANARAPVGSCKKTKSENSIITRSAKGKKKEKLGERITALQQLVSPFGKTDTASVLHEALGYIRFLQDQVQVLYSPYLQPSSSLTENGEIRGSSEKLTDDLRSRGLCLVPLKLTVHVADSNGADLWSSAAVLNNFSSH